jgi:hypothetical protein
MTADNPEREPAPEAAPTRGRKPGFSMTAEHRLKIQNSNILTALIQHVTEGRAMESTQVTAGLGLLRKVLPDLATTTIQGDEEGGPIEMVHKIERLIVDPSN